MFFSTTKQINKHVIDFSVLTSIDKLLLLYLYFNNTKKNKLDIFAWYFSCIFNFNKQWVRILFFSILTWNVRISFYQNVQNVQNDQNESTWVNMKIFTRSPIPLFIWIERLLIRFVSYISKVKINNVVLDMFDNMSSE